MIAFLIAVVGVVIVLAIIGVSYDRWEALGSLCAAILIVAGIVGFACFVTWFVPDTSTGDRDERGCVVFKHKPARTLHYDKPVTLCPEPG